MLEIFIYFTNIIFHNTGEGVEIPGVGGWRQTARTGTTSCSLLGGSNGAFIQN